MLISNYKLYKKLYNKGYVTEINYDVRAVKNLDSSNIVNLLFCVNISINQTKSNICMIFICINLFVSSLVKKAQSSQVSENP